MNKNLNDITNIYQPNNELLQETDNGYGWIVDGIILALAIALPFAIYFYNWR